MPNEFVIKNGYVSEGDSSISGSLAVSGSININGTNVQTLSIAYAIALG